jgi:uncharacterized protein (DUF488 family)
MSLTVWTVGHSTRLLPDFLEILAVYHVELVADVRRFPGSRRQPVPDTMNTTWRHPSFRGYADYLAGEEFAAGLVELLTLAWRLRTAVMCAELLWWRCHRRMIADVLVSLGPMSSISGMSKRLRRIG